MEIRTNLVNLFLTGLILVFFPACNNEESIKSPTVEPAITQLTSTSSIHLESTPTEIARGETDKEISSSSGLPILQCNLLRDNFGNSLVSGLIHNDSVLSASNIEVEIHFFDSSGNFLTKDWTSTAISTLQPGSISPFVLATISNIDGAVTSQCIVINHETVNLETIEVKFQHTISSTDNKNNFHVTGEIYNGNLDPIIINDLAAAVFDSDGKILFSSGQSTTNQYLDPGESSPFRVSFNAISFNTSTINDYQTYLDAVISPPFDYHEIIILEPYAYFDKDGIFHLVGEVINNSEESLTVNLTAAVYNDEENVFDSSSVNLPISAIYPGETLPYDFISWGPINLQNPQFLSPTNYSVQWNPISTQPINRKFISLNPAEPTYQFDDSTGTFNGLITNDSGYVLENVIVIVSLYNAESGKILAMNSKVITPELVDGSTFPYMVKVQTHENLNFESIEVKILVKGEISD